MTTGNPECTLCREDIKPGARKCTHCDAYQGGLFFLNLSAPVLSVMLAFVSVMAVVVPPTVAALKAPSSQITVAFQYFEDGTAHFIASNDGTRGGSIGEIYLDYGQQNWRFRLQPKSERYIAPSASRHLTFDLPCKIEDGPTVHYATNLDQFSRPMPKAARLNVVVVEFDGSTRTASIAIADLSGVQVITDSLHRCVQASLAKRGDANGTATRPTLQP